MKKITVVILCDNIKPNASIRKPTTNKRASKIPMNALIPLSNRQNI